MRTAVWIQLSVQGPRQMCRYNENFLRWDGVCTANGMVILTNEKCTHIYMGWPFQHFRLHSSRPKTNPLKSKLMPSNQTINRSVYNGPSNYIRTAESSAINKMVAVV